MKNLYDKSRKIKYITVSTASCFDTITPISTRPGNYIILNISNSSFLSRYKYKNLRARAYQKANIRDISKKSNNIQLGNFQIKIVERMLI